MDVRSRDSGSDVTYRKVVRELIDGCVVHLAHVIRDA
jgi:hypothetical protein